MKLTIYQTRADLDHPGYVGTIAILEHCMIPYEVVVDVRETMVRSHGKVNPAFGFVVDKPKGLEYGPAITDCLALALWINHYGFIPL